MRSLFLLLVVGAGWGGLTRVKDRNVATHEAALAYARQDFAGATRLYQQAVEEFGGRSEALLLNLGHACARAGQPEPARTYYGQLLKSTRPGVRSIAQQQLAVLLAERGEYAQAVALSRQALLSNPQNAAARYNYELLRTYLARHGNGPHLPPPVAARAHPQDPDEQLGRQNRVTEGTQRPGELDDPTQPDDPRNAPQARDDQRGRRNPDRPGAAPGRDAAGGFQPGQGTERDVASGTEPSTTRGLSRTADGPEASGGRSRRAGTEAATPEATQLQTQRARLDQMNLSTGQAQQVLEALNAAEQQYLQQLPRKTTTKPEPGKPTW